MSIKPLYICIICSLLFSAKSSDSLCQIFEWAKQAGNTDWDEGIAIATDAGGNVYTTGYFRGTVDFDPGPGVFNLTSGGTQDVFICKLDPSGHFIWAKQLGGPGWEECHAIVVDAYGNIYTTGFFLGIVDFDPSAVTFNLISGSGGDAFICKLDSTGNFVWAKQIGGSLAVTSYAIAVDANGNVYTTGFFDGIADFDPGVANYNLTVVGYSDIFIHKLDSSGTFVWVKQLGGTDGELGYSIALDDNGNVYTTGTFFGTVDFDPGAGTHFLNSSGGQEIYISKLDAAGNFVWAKQMGGDVGYSIATDNSGNVYTTGFYGWNDISINKLDSSGNIIWIKVIGASIGVGIAVDDNHNVYTTGWFFGTEDFDPGPSAYQLTSIGSADAFVSKLDSSGNFIWAKQLGGTDEVKSRSIAVDGNDNVYLTGQFNGTADFDPASTTYNLTSSGSYDIFIHKMIPDVTGVLENNFTDGFKVYPNPSDGIFIIEFDKEFNSLNFVLKNILGQVVQTPSAQNGSRVEMQINGACGVYILEIADETKLKNVIKILKN